MSLSKTPFILATLPYYWKAVTPPPSATTASAAKGDKAQLSKVEKGFGQYIPFLAKIYKVRRTFNRDSSR